MIPACTSNACQQGRDRCPCTEACQLAEIVPWTGWRMALTWAAVLSSGAAVVGLFASLFFRP